MTRRGFSMQPSQHIIRRQWQSPTSPSSTAKDSTNNNCTHATRHILSTHLRFVLKWLYSLDRIHLVETLRDEDTLRVICVAILFDLNTLVDTCLERYISHQLSIDTIVSDLETIRQLPRDHKAYHQLRDAALLLLLRYGADHPHQLARLPVDYMADVLSADVLFIDGEYERYQLLREVLMSFMHSVGKITWTFAGPLDQDYKRLSGFVHSPMILLKQQQTQQQYTSLVSDGTLPTTQKRKRDTPETSVTRVAKDKHRHLSRLSFSSHVPFEQLMEDASSGGVIDKATILSYLLRTTVNYSNMTFEQLSIVRQDGIVDEHIVFKALWQREALERLLFPFSYQQSQQAAYFNTSSSISAASSQVATPRFGKTDTDHGMTTAATSDDQERDRQVLLGAPQFRYAASICLKLPKKGDHAGWDVDKTGTTSTSSEQSPQSSNISMEQSIELDKGSQHTDGKNDDGDDGDDYNYYFDNDADGMEAILACDAIVNSSGKATKTNNQDESQQQQQQQQAYGNIYNKTVYTEAKYILGHWHRVRMEAQVLPRSLLQIQDDDNSGNDSTALLCRFELQRDRATKQSTSSHQPDSTQYQSAHRTISSQQNQQYTSQPLNNRRPIVATTHGSKSASHLPAHHQEPAQQQSKIRYAIYCLNQHDGLVKNDQVDPEDRVLIPVSEVVESSNYSEQSTGYVGQVLLNTDMLDNTNIITVDMMVALEIFGFTNKNIE
ncbi:unnamed protein product [Absidia cylindrospora]